MLTLEKISTFLSQQTGLLNRGEKNDSEYVLVPSVIPDAPFVFLFAVLMARQSSRCKMQVIQDHLLLLSSLCSYL